VHPSLQAPVHSFFRTNEPGQPGAGSGRQARLGRALGAKEQKASWAGPDAGSERGLQALVRLFFE